MSTGIAIAVTAVIFACAAFDHVMRKRHERFIAAQRAAWIASNEELMRSLEANTALLGAVRTRAIFPSIGGRA